MSLNSLNVKLEEVICVNCNTSNVVELTRTRSRHKGRCYGILSRVVVCKNCGLAYLSPRMSAKDYQEFYLDEYWQLNAGDLAPVASRHDNLAQRIYGFYTQNCPATMTQMGNILDIGCGTGETLDLLSQKTHSIGYGIEPSESAAKWASEKSGHTIFHGDFFDNHFSDAFFDLIVASAVMEHFLDPLIALVEMKRLIKPGGYVFIRVPDLEACNFATSDVPKIFKVVHTHYFTQKTLGGLLNKVGFEIVKMEAKPSQAGESQGEIWCLAQGNNVNNSQGSNKYQDYRQIIVEIWVARVRCFFPYWYRKCRKKVRNGLGQIARKVLPTNLYARLRGS